MKTETGAAITVNGFDLKVPFLTHIGMAEAENMKLAEC